MNTKQKNVAGGTPVPSGPKHVNHEEKEKSSKQVKKEAIEKSEKENMTNKKGYNEVPNNVPVKSVKKKAE